MTQDTTICIVGMGYVGMTLAVGLAEAGYRVMGVERNPHIVDCVAQGRPHFAEQGLDAPLARHVQNGTLTCGTAMPKPGEASVFIITVGTPLGNDGAVNLTAIREVANNISGVLQEGDLVLLRSTVKPGTTRQVVKPALDAAGKPYGLAFCPERTLEGSALKELTSLPQIIGGIDAASTRRASALFARFAPKIIETDTIEAAEMVKLINNTGRDLMFAFANEIAGMCDAIGVNAMGVIRAACEDYPRSRIALPGPVGGPCLEKDPHILAEGLRPAGYTPAISLAGRHLNEALPAASIARVDTLLQQAGAPMNGAKIAILGLAFKGKPETSDTRGSMAHHILREARALWPGALYTAYDPVVDAAEFEAFGCTRCTSIADAFTDATLVLIQNNHADFAALDLPQHMAAMQRPGMVYDYWNLFDATAMATPTGTYYGGLGTTSAIAQHLDHPALKKAV